MMTRKYFLVSVILLFSAQLQASTVVFQHTGNTDPTLEGWSVGGGGGPGQSQGPLTNDAGSGLNAWFVNDTSGALFTTFGYSQAPTALQNSQASTGGWTLRTRLRVANSSDAINNHGSIIANYVTGGTQFLMAFGSEGDSDPIVSLWNDISDDFSGTSYTLQGSGGGYHLYELIFDPVAGTADLFINGVERISNYGGVTGVSASANSVSFGAGSSFDTGQGNYNLVEWEINAVPLPATIWLFGSGLLGLIGVARHKKA